MKTKKNNIPSEYEECKTLVIYLELLKSKGDILVFTKTAQETFTKSFWQKNKNRVTGVRAGLPDYVIVFKNGIVFFLEMKRIKGGRLSPAQNDWISALLQTDCIIKVAKGAEEAILIIDKILKI